MILVRRDGKSLLTNEGIFWIPAGLTPGGQVPVDPATLMQPMSPAANNAGTGGAPVLSAPGTPPPTP
jgi:hypothetical protein